MGAGRFGEWLTNNIDWAVSRDRYWGTPLPIWVCEKDESHAEAIGGYAELAERSGVKLPDGFDPHKPFIDRYKYKCKCGAIMKRTPEVIDAWFDSGSMPFAQWHFPFENREKFERYYPADFIAEGIDQTRGWFYSLLAIATGLGDALPNNLLAHESHDASPGDTAPYRAVVVNDLVLDAEGQKMSKRLGNIIDPNTVIPRYGADAVRLFLTTSSQLWTPRRFDEPGIARHRRPIPGHLQERLHRHFRGVCEFRVGALRQGSGAGRPSAARSVDSFPIGDGGGGGRQAAESL